MPALALKYRPSSFKELVGQLHAAQSLKNAIEFNKIGHAYLFHGSRGVGKTSTARILARALNCVQGPTTEPCGVCEFCKDIAAGVSTDVIEMDAASNRGIEHIRNLRENSRFAPMRARYKIYIIDEVHMLTMESFNALLKTLEEPPEHVIFILATTEHHKVPETILSRCQTFTFRKFTVEEIIGRLSYVLQQEGIAFDPDALLPIAQKAEGSMRDALSLLDQVVAYSGNEAIRVDHITAVLGLSPSETCLAFLEAIRSHDLATQLKLIHELTNEGQNLKRFLWDCISWLKDLCLVKHDIRLPGLSAAALEKLGKIAQGWENAELTAVFDSLYHLHSDWNLYQTARSSEIRISLEMALVELQEKLSAPSVSSLVRKLSALAQAVETGAEFDNGQTLSEKKNPEIAATIKPEQPKDISITGATPVESLDNKLDIDKIIAQEFLIDRSGIPPEEQLFREE